MTCLMTHLMTQRHSMLLRVLRQECCGDRQQAAHVAECTDKMQPDRLRSTDCWLVLVTCTSLWAMQQAACTTHTPVDMARPAG